jgi:hypothetical protein
MDIVVRQLMTEFCVHRGLTALPESERFEAFATHCVLTDFTFDPFEADEFRIGGSADGGIDGYAVVLNGRLFRTPYDLEAALAVITDASPTVVMLQAKTSSNMDRKVISDLRVRVENILRGDDVLDNAVDAEPLRECLRVMRKHLARLNSRGVRLAVYYANTSSQANSEIRREAQRAAQYLSGTGIISGVEFHCLGRDELARRYERSQWSSSAQLSFAEHYVMPSADGVTQARGGVVAASDLIAALSDEAGALNPALFSENIREFQPNATVNDEIRAALRDEAQRRRFAVLNNGVTIVARSMQEWPKSPVVMRDFQIVDGCQTCHVLAEDRDRLDDVLVKVQVFECDDDDVVNEIVMATNRQTAIPKVYFVNRRNLLKRLDVYYRHRRAAGGVLLFGRKPASRGNSLRNGVIDLNRQLRAYQAMFGRLAPTNARRDLDEDFDKRFKQATEPEFYAAAAALYRWNWLIDTRRVNQRYRALAYQAIAVFGTLYGVRPRGGSDKERSKRLAAIEEVTWSDGQWERLGLKIQSILDEAIEASPVPDFKSAAASASFGEAVVALARRLPRH